MKAILCATLAEGFYKSRYELIEMLATRGYELLLIAPDELDIALHFSSLPVRYRKIRMNRTGLNIMDDLKTIKELRSIIRSEKPDLVYAFGGAKAAIYTAYAARKRNCYCMINGLGSIYNSTNKKSIVLQWYMDFLYKTSLHHTRGVLFQNQNNLMEFVSRKIVKKEHCIVVNGSGVNLANFRPSPLPPRPVFLFVGRLLRDKGIFEYVNAAKQVKKRYPEAEFHVVGPYDTNPTAVKEKDVTQWVNDGIVQYYGYQEDVRPYYENASVFVLPSYHEGTPRTCLEAMATGRPVITTDTPGCRETVLNGVTGFLVPARNVTILCEKMMLLAGNSALRKKMGDSGYQYVKKKYDVRSVNHSILSFLLREE